MTGFANTVTTATIFTPRTATTTRTRTQAEIDQMAAAMTTFKGVSAIYAKVSPLYKPLKQKYTAALTLRLTPEYLAADILYSEAKRALGIATLRIMTDTSQEALNEFIRCTAVKDKLRNEGIIGITETKIDLCLSEQNNALSVLTTANENVKKATDLITSLRASYA